MNGTVCSMGFLSTSLPSTLKMPVPPSPKALPSKLEVERDRVLAGLEFWAFPRGALDIKEVVEKHRLAPTDSQFALAQEQAVTGEASAFGDDHAFRAAFGNFHLGGDGVRPLDDARGRTGRHAAQLTGIGEGGAPRRRARTWREHARDGRVVEREHVVFLRLGHEEILHFLELVRHLGGEIVDFPCSRI